MVFWEKEGGKLFFDLRSNWWKVGARIWSGVESVGAISVDASRQGYESMSRVQAGAKESVAQVKEFSFQAGPNSKVIVRVYWSQLEKDLPLLMFVHGGGWSRGSLDTHDALCRNLAKKLNCVVVSVGYRLAPEHPFPAGYDDVFADYHWCINHAINLGADPKKIAVAGDSSGGNLVAALVCRLVEENKQMPNFQVLIYPITDVAFATESIDTFDGYILSKSGLESYREIYLPQNANFKDFRFSPIHYPHLEKICPTIVLAAEMDPLVDEGKLYAESLKKAGGKVSYLVADGTVHAYMQMFISFPKQTQQSLNLLGLYSPQIAA